MTDSKELVERLRAATPTASSILRASTGEDPVALDNDIATACHEAADRIETLKAEVERLGNVIDGLNNAVIKFQQKALKAEAENERLREQLEAVTADAEVTGTARNPLTKEIKRITVRDAVRGEFVTLASTDAGSAMLERVKRLEGALTEVKSRMLQYEHINLVGRTQPAKRGGTMRNCIKIINAALEGKDDD